MNSTAPARVQQKQAVRELNRIAATADYVDAIVNRDPDGGHGFSYPNRATRRALRPVEPAPNVERSNRSDARPRKQRAKAVRAARAARAAEHRRAAKYGVKDGAR